ncbi:hypothetical protein ABIA30_005381 [Mycobacterium sp. MAA66]
MGGDKLVIGTVTARRSQVVGLRVRVDMGTSTFGSWPSYAATT